jgi:nitroreductase
MEVYEAITKRRSVRVFKEKPVDYSILEKCVDAARLAPTAMNSQLCEYVIADDKKLVLEILDSIGMWGGAPKPAGGWAPEKKPAAYIIVLINLELEKIRGCGRTNAFIDVGLAMENIALAALEQGVGTCIMTGFDKEGIKKTLNAPEKYEAVAMIALGYPDEKFVLETATDSVKRWVDEQGVRHIPKRRLEDILHRNRFK